MTSTTFETSGPLNQLVHVLLLQPKRHFIQVEETAIVNNRPPSIDARGGYITQVRVHRHGPRGMRGGGLDGPKGARQRVCVE